MLLFSRGISGADSNMSSMMRMRSYKIVLLLLARHSKKYSGFDLVKKVARKYRHADEYKVALMLRDLGVIDFNDEKPDYDWERVAELMEMVIDE